MNYYGEPWFFPSVLLEVGYNQLISMGFAQPLENPKETFKGGFWLIVLHIRPTRFP